MIGSTAYGQTAYSAPGGGIRVYDMEGNIVLETSIPNLPEATYAGSGAIDVIAGTSFDPTVLKDVAFSTTLAFGHSAQVKRIRISESIVTLELDFQGSLGAKCSITIEAELSGVIGRIKDSASTIQLAVNTLTDITKQTSGSSTTDLSFELEGINIRERDTSSSTGIEINTSIVPATKLGGEVGVTLDLTPDITETRIRDAISTIETTLSVLDQVTALRQGSSTVGLNLDIEGIVVKQTQGVGEIGIVANLNLIPTRQRSQSTSVTLEFNTSITPDRIRGMVGAIDIAQNILAEPTARFTSGSDIELSLGTVADFKAVLSGSSTIQLVVEPEGVPLGTELLLEFTGSLASGDTIKIDGENFLITDPSTGENLRPQFDLNDWPDIGPDGAKLRWEDPETGRTIEIVIEKEDRTL